MSLEAVTYPNDLTVTNPVATDVRSEGDDHLRNIKVAIKNAFPGLAGRAWRHQTKSINYTVLATDNMSIIYVDTGSVTVALTAAATLGNGHFFLLYGEATIIDPDGAETVNGETTITTAPNSFNLISCNGTAFYCAELPFRMNGSQTTMANHATTAAIWDAADTIFFNTAVTVTAVPDSPGPGIHKWLSPSAGTIYTHDGARINVQGGASYTTAAGDWILLTTRSTILNDLTVFKGDGSVIDAIPKTLVDAAGDLLYATAADTVARLAIGTAHKTFRVNAGATAGEWTDALTLGTEDACSGIAVDFTPIPTGTERVTINFFGVSLSGTDSILVQLGDAGGFEATGYLGASSNNASGSNYTTGFGILSAAAACVIHGSLILTLEDATNFTWCAMGVFGRSDTTQVVQTGGTKSLSAELTQVRITRDGVDTFDAGSINIAYE